VVPGGDVSQLTDGVIGLVCLGVLRSAGACWRDGLCWLRRDDSDEVPCLADGSARPIGIAPGAALPQLRLRQRRVRWYRSRIQRSASR
jgi:hypothetical protein